MGIGDALKWLLTQFQKMLDFFLSLPKKIWDIFVSFFMYVYNFFFHEETGLVWVVLREFLDFMFAAIDKSLGAVIRPLIVQYGPVIKTVGEKVGELNVFFPVVEAGQLLGIFLVFLVVVLTIRILLKIIPGAGG